MITREEFEKRIEEEKKLLEYKIGLESSKRLTATEAWMIGFGSAIITYAIIATASYFYAKHKVEQALGEIAQISNQTSIQIEQQNKKQVEEIRVNKFHLNPDSDKMKSIESKVRNMSKIECAEYLDNIAGMDSTGRAYFFSQYGPDGSWIGN